MRRQKCKLVTSIKYMNHTIRFKMIPLLALALIVSLLWSHPSLAQISDGGTPRSFEMSLKASTDKFTMAAVDVQALQAEDDAAGKDVPFRHGYPFDVYYSLENSGSWMTLPDGGRLWRLTVECPGAYSINLLYDDFHLPAGAELFVYNEDRSTVLGAFTAKNNKDHRQFATGLTKGGICTVEYYEPLNVEFAGTFVITRVVHGYKDMFSWDNAKQVLGFGDSGFCNNNVICPEGDPWRDEIRAVAMVLLSSGTRWCSGSMVNNVRQDQTPYFLTANHCLGSESTWIIMFNYESPTCTPSQDGPTWMTVQGTTLRASRSTSDFGLLELQETPPDSYELYYLGWSAVDVEGDSAVGIHHPSGDVKKISFDYGTYTSTSYLGTSGTTHWRIGNWEDGTTEGGSSGSPLFNKHHQVIGQLHGGYASCTSITADWYGKFSLSWDGGSSASTRLKDWLDPDNTGTLVLEGYDPYAGIEITHTPLEDTKDSSNDYEALCTIVSPEPLIPDSLLLWYQTDIDPTWHADTLAVTGGADEYHGFIPAQSPGTEVSYYLEAHATGGFADTTETFQFRVIDYAVLLSPSYQSLSGAVDDTIWYSLTAENEGVYTDSYDLTTENALWNTALYDETGSSVITSIGPLDADDVADFLVRVIVPASNFGDEDQATIRAISTGDPSVSSSAVVRSISAGQPLTVPFYETFPTTSIDNGKWVQASGVELNENALMEPSSPYSANFDGSPGGHDTLASQTINLSGLSGISISYHYQRTGGGDSPESGDDLFVDYFNQSGQWILLHQYSGAGDDMGTFEAATTGVPLDGYHSAFRIRFRNNGTTGAYDDWFVDDIRVDYGPSISVAPGSFAEFLLVNDSTEDLLIIGNAGPGGLSYTLDVTPDLSKNTTFVALLASGQVNPSRYDYPDQYTTYEQFKGIPDQRIGKDVKFNAGGPDNFGYIWIDSDEGGGPQFNWIDISATGTDITAELDDDNYSGPYTIGFDFPFYDGSYSEFYLGSNGLIGFGPVTGLASQSNNSVPSATDPNNCIFWCWDDLDITDGQNPGAKVYYENTGSALVIQFVNYPEFQASVGDVITAEVILYPGGVIKMQYQSIGSGFDILGNTVGIEEVSGIDGLEIAFNTAYLHDGLAIQIIKPDQWLSFSSTSGALLSDEADTITVQFSSVDVDTGVYNANITINSNDPDPGKNPWIVPTQLTVASEPPAWICGDADGNDVVEISDAVFLIEYIFVPGSPAPDPPESADVDCNEIVEISDATYLISYIFIPGAPEPCADCPQ